MAPEREVREIVVERRYLRQEDALGTMVYEPGSDRQQASYERYVFDRADWDRATDGASADWARARLRLEVLHAETTRSTPPPDQPSPEGGFRHVQFHCRPLQFVRDP